VRSVNLQDIQDATIKIVQWRVGGHGWVEQSEKKSGTI